MQGIEYPIGHYDELYNSKNPLVHYLHNKRLDRIVQQIPAGEKIKILDVGCGEGHLIERMHNKYPQHDYYGVDIFQSEVDATKKRCPYVKVARADLSDTLPYSADAMDVIICTGVLEHIPKYQFAIWEMERCLKKDGLLIITFPNEVLWTAARFVLRRKPVKIIDHFHSFSPTIIDVCSDSKLERVINLPMDIFPFALSLEAVMVFRK